MEKIMNAEKQPEALRHYHAHQHYAQQHRRQA